MTVLFFLPVLLVFILYPLACYGLIRAMIWWTERSISDEEDRADPMLSVKRTLLTIRSRPLLCAILYPATLLIAFLLRWDD